MKSATLERLLRDRSEKSSVVLATNLNTGDERLVYPGDLEGENGLDPAIAQAVREAFRSDRSKTIETEEGPVFLHVFNPPLRMIIVGAVHIAQPLARMAALAGYDVTIVDPRAAFATDERFPGVTLLTEWPDDALETLAPDSRTAVVTLTHDPKLDDPALEVALRSSARPGNAGRSTAVGWPPPGRGRRSRRRSWPPTVPGAAARPRSRAASA